MLDVSERERDTEKSYGCRTYRTITQGSTHMHIHSKCDICGLIQALAERSRCWGKAKWFHTKSAVCNSQLPTRYLLVSCSFYLSCSLSTLTYNHLPLTLTAIAHCASTPVRSGLREVLFNALFYICTHKHSHSLDQAVW